MKSLKTILSQQNTEIGIVERDDSHLKKIKSPGGQEFFVHSTVSDMVAQGDRTQTEVINPGEHADYPNMHNYTLQSKKRAVVFPAVNIPPQRQRTVR